MADYKEIKGFNVQKISSDPSNILIGDIWYNSTSGALKVGVQSGAWSSGPAFPTGVGSTSGCGTETAALSMGGNPQLTVSGEWDGTSWTTNPGMNTGRFGIAGFGIQTAAVAVGGDANPDPARQMTNTETYDGTSWTNGTAYPIVISIGGGLGTNAAGLVAGGTTTPSFAITGVSNEYASGTWTAGGAQATTSRAGGSVGTQAAGLYMGGYTGPNENTSRITTTQTYDGTSWSNSPVSINNARNGSGASGTQSLALMYGGRFNSPPNPTNIQAFTESFDGSSWAATGTLSVARAYPGRAGTNNTGAVAFGGNPAPAAPDVTETFAVVGAAETITTS